MEESGLEPEAVNWKGERLMKDDKIKILRTQNNQLPKLMEMQRNFPPKKIGNEYLACTPGQLGQKDEIYPVTQKDQPKQGLEQALESFLEPE